MASAEEPDRLSQLPDELLQHILHLAPCREAETTAVLSRRWRGLWPPPTGAAVKIDIPSGENRCPDATLRHAEMALAAAQGPVERLAIHVGESSEMDDLDDVVGDVLSHPTSRGAQDVRIAADNNPRRFTAAGGVDNDNDASFSWIPDEDVGVFELSFGAVVPCAAHLRVLHITNCSDLTLPPPASTFPCLEVLRLRRCKVTLEGLQDMVVASPQLAALQLEYLFLSTKVSRPRPTYPDSYIWCFPQSLCCPGVTTLVLVNCCSKHGHAVELDVPRVQHFRYRGNIGQFTLRSPLPDVMRAYLHILDPYYNASETCERFWNFLKNFSNAKVLKLKLDSPIDFVATLERKRIMDLLAGENHSAELIMLCVEHLEIDAPYNPESDDVGVAIGNMLQCCPAVHDLKLKLNTADQPRNRSTSLQSKAQLDFRKSIDHFRRRRDPLVPKCRDDGKFEVSDIPGLSDRWFHFGCLQFNLKRMSMQFNMDKYSPADCVGVRLLKFFVERGMALEEMYIDDGNMKLWEHMNCKISSDPANYQPYSDYHILAKMSRALSMNQFSSSKIISGWFHSQKLQVRRTNPWSASRSFTISPLADR